MKEVMAQVEQVAASETRVCIRGETGTGKELVARTLHEKSPRRAGPFISLNCAAVPSELMETELFGHEKGSFTGAASRHTGKFEQAHHGTLFLDEIGDMPMTMQAKLLRVLEEGEIERVGGDKPFTVDVRVVVATHRNLEEQVRQGTFREDLYHRVFVFPVVLPPLRERREDIRVLAEHFIKQLDEQNHWKSKQPFCAKRVAELESYPVARKRPRTTQRRSNACCFSKPRTKFRPPPSSALYRNPPRRHVVLLARAPPTLPALSPTACCPSASKLSNAKRYSRS